MYEQAESFIDPEVLLRQLRHDLRRIYRLRGEPSTRDIAKSLDKALSHTTVAAVLKCLKTPTWGQLELVVEALGGPTGEFHRQWVAIRDAEDLVTVPRNIVEPEREAFAGEVKVVEDLAALTFDEGMYKLNQKRLIRNAGTGPVNGYLVRVRVDRFLHFARLSGSYHLQYPLRADDLQFKAWFGLDRKTPLTWTNNLSTSSVIERWLKFPDDGIAAGHESWIEYEYEVSESQWGNWFQRAVRHRTRRLSVTLDFPSELVSGEDAVTISFSSPESKVPGQFASIDLPVDYVAGDRSRYSWSVDGPSLHSRYRAEWSFPFWPTAKLAAIGIAQFYDGHPLLTQPSLPVQFSSAGTLQAVRDTARALAAAADRVEKVHGFTGGMGLAAPQIGIPQRIVLLRTVTGDEFYVNPTVLHSSGALLDSEGCLSFFDVRGSFVRPSSVRIRYSGLDGSEKIEDFGGRKARDLLHEIDHLDGAVFVDRMTERDPVVLVRRLRLPSTMRR